MDTATEHLHPELCTKAALGCSLRELQQSVVGSRNKLLALTKNYMVNYMRCLTATVKLLEA